MALAVSFISGLLALGAAIIGAKNRVRGDADASWWVLSSLVLTIPVVSFLVMV
jgi:hypothetical protein